MLGQERLVSALLYDAAIVDDDDLIGPGNRAQTMGDDERGASFQQFFERPLNDLLGVCVNRRRSLVEDEDTRVCQQRTRK